MNEKIDCFSINLDQGDTKECGVETFEVPVRQAYRFSRDFVKIGPNRQVHIKLKGRAYDHIIYCQDPRPLELQIIYTAVKFNGENSERISKTYIETDRRELFTKTVNEFSSLYEGKIKSEVIKFIPDRD